MKAKEIARIILDDSKIEGVDKLKVAADNAYRIIKIASEKAGSGSDVQRFQSKLTVWREALSLWKAVVSAVHEEDPRHPIFINLFGAVFTIVAPGLFSILVEHHVFINYQLTQKEKLLVSQQRIEAMFSHV